MTKHDNSIHKRRWEELDEEPLDDGRRKRIKNRILQTLSLEEDLVKATSLFSLRRTYMAAASLVLLVGVCIGLFIHFSASSSEEVMAEYSTSTGETQSIMLPDGSTVWLNAESQLTIQADFLEEYRRVTLEGEAYFEVAPDPDRPFQVQSDELLTQVLGTRFNIRSYPSDPVRQVTVMEGKVRVKKATKNEGLHVGKQYSIDLVVGEQLEVRPGELSTTGRANWAVREVQPLLEIAWTKQELIFIRESFVSLARTFERWYGVEFIFEDASLKEELFVCHFKELSLEKSLKILSKMADFNYKIEKGQVILSAK